MSKLKALLHIGAEKSAVSEVRHAIMDILKNQTSDEPTKIKALEVLSTAAQVANTMVSNCNFVGK